MSPSEYIHVYADYAFQQQFVFEKLFDVFKACGFAAVNAHGLYMDGGNGYDMCAVFPVEIVHVRYMLEVVGIQLAALYHVVGLYVIGEFHNFKGNVLRSQDFLRDGKDFRVRGRGSSYAYLGTRKGIIVDGSIIAVGGGLYSGNNGAFILLSDEISNLLAFQGSYQCKDNRIVLTAFFDGKDIRICRILYLIPQVLKE